MKLRLAIIAYVLLVPILILPFFAAQVESSTSTNTLYAHTETTTIGGVNYYLLKLSSADGPATTLNASAATTGRKLMGRWVYSLSGIVSIPASTWTVTYRAMKSSSATAVVAHGDVDILIRKADGNFRNTIASHVANSPNITLINTWQTLTGTYSWTDYTVVDQTDYLEVAYYIEVTTAQTSKYVRLRVDDSALPLADQTKVENVKFTYPNQAPIASFTFSPSSPLIYDTVTFDASASYDPDGSIVSYAWNFGDGNVTTVTSPIITHVYPAAASTVNYTVTLTVTDNEGSTGFATQIVPVTNPTVLEVSLPAGTYHDPDADHWLSQCSFLNITGLSGTFTVRIDDIHPCITSYNTHLIIALNGTAYEYLDSLTVDTTSIPKTSFTNSTPQPYGYTLTWEEDVYPTWFSDIYVVGDIGPKGYKDVQVSVTFTNANNVAMHFDAYGSTDSPPPPTSKGHVTHNPHEKDSTVLFYSPAVVQYYLTVTSPYGTVGGQGWYVSGSTAYASLNTGIVNHGNGTRRVFLYWSGDASGTNYAQSDPILMNSNKTAIAVWKTQYYLTVTSPYGTPSGANWYDSGTNAYAGLDTGVVNHGNGTRHVFTNWAGDASGTNYASSNPIMMDGPKTAIAVWKTQHFLTVTSPYGITSGADWYDANTIAYASLNTGTEDHGNGTRRIFTNWSGDASGTNYAQSDPITMDAPKTAIADWKTQHRLIVRTNGLGTYVTNVYNDTTVLGSATDATPYVGWFDNGDLILLNINSPIVDGSKRFLFTQWSGDAAGTSRPASFTMNTAKDITANYKTQYQITVTATPSGAVGGTFKVTYTQCGTTHNNEPHTTSWTEWVDAGTDVTVSEPQDIIDVSLGTRLKFERYDPSASVTMDGAKTITLVYKTQYLVTFTQNGLDATAIGTIVTVNDTSVTVLPYEIWVNESSWITYAYNDIIPSTISDQRFRLVSVTGPSSPFHVTGPVTVTGNYKTQYLLTVLTDPAGLSPQPSRNPTGESGPANGWWYDASTDVSLAAQTVTGYTFNNWDVNGISNGTGVNPITVTVNAPKTATAHYTQIITYSLTITTTTGGTTSPAPATYTHTAGTTVEVTATPNAGYRFDHWVLNGSDAGSANPISILMNNSYNLQAVFAETHTLIITVSEGGTTDPAPGTYTYQTPTDVTVRAIPNANFELDHWVYDGIDKGSQNPIIVHVGSSHTLHAVFIERPGGGYSISLTKRIPTVDIAAYTMLVALFGVAISLFRKKGNRK